jgi:hypothetical protein
MHLVETSPAADALRAANWAASNDLFTLSIEAGGLAGLLQLVAESGRLQQEQQLAIGSLADMAERIEKEITAISERLADRQEAD